MGTTERLRILLICQEFPGFRVSGGIGTYTAVIARELAARGHEIHVLCVGSGLTRGTHHGPGYVVHTGPYAQIRGLGRPLGLPRLGLWTSQAFSVWREYRHIGIRFDVVESPELYAESAGIALLERQTPLVVRLHSGAAFLAIPPHDHGRDFRATVTIENFAVRRADIVASTAPYLAAAKLELGLDAGRTREIIYPVPERPAADANDSRVVLFVGRLERRKCPELLIDAAPHVLSAIPEARFRFLGMDTDDPQHGSYREFLINRARRLGVDDSIEFGDPVPQEQVQVEMSAAGVCAFPSLRESFGLVVADAGAIARPVVVSDIDAFNDFVTDGVTGRVVKRADGNAWADALVAALNDLSGSREMALRLRDYLRERAAPGVVGEQVLESYRAAIQTRAACRGRNGP